MNLILAFLNAGVSENGFVSPSVEGTPQGATTLATAEQHRARRTRSSMKTTIEELAPKMRFDPAICTAAALPRAFVVAFFIVLPTDSPKSSWKSENARHLRNAMTLSEVPRAENSLAPQQSRAGSLQIES